MAPRWSGPHSPEMRERQRYLAKMLLQKGPELEQQLLGKARSERLLLVAEVLDDIAAQVIADWSEAPLPPLVEPTKSPAASALRGAALR